MRLLIATLLLTACAVSTGPVPSGPDLDASAEDLQQALNGANPQPLLAWALEPHTLVDTSSGCPQVSIIEQADGTLERWVGDCTQPDGTQVVGSLTWLDGHSTAWTAGEGFAVYGPDGLTLSLDGAVEIQGEGALWLAEANATTCEGLGCADGPVAVDLSYTLFPSEGYPTDYDLTVSGVVADTSGTIVIEAAWSIDADICTREPIHGLVAIKRGAHQTLTLNGASACDACGSWMVQGREAPTYCSPTP